MKVIWLDKEDKEVGLYDYYTDKNGNAVRDSAENIIMKAVKFKSVSK